MIVFATIGGVGIAVLLPSLVLGDLVDFGDGDVSATSSGDGATARALVDIGPRLT